MRFDVGAHLVCAFNLVPESTSGAPEVRPYGKQVSFATYTRESPSTASLRLRRPGRRRIASYSRPSTRRPVSEIICGVHCGSHTM